MKIFFSVDLSVENIDQMPVGFSLFSLNQLAYTDYHKTGIK